MPRASLAKYQSAVKSDYRELQKYECSIGQSIAWVNSIDLISYGICSHIHLLCWVLVFFGSHHRSCAIGEASVFWCDHVLLALSCIMHAAAWLRNSFFFISQCFDTLLQLLNLLPCLSWPEQLLTKLMWQEKQGGCAVFSRIFTHSFAELYWLVATRIKNLQTVRLMCQRWMKKVCCVRKLFNVQHRHASQD